MLLVIADCAHASDQTQQHLAAVNKKCLSQQWPNEVSKVDCLNAVEATVIKKDIPFSLKPYKKLASKRRILAQQHDKEIYSVQAAWNQYLQGIKEATEILDAQEPKLVDKKSALSKDIVAANPAAACQSQILITHLNCTDAITRPIWKRDAPDTVNIYDAFHQKRLQLAQDFDNGGAFKIITAADKRYSEGINLAKNEFFSDVLHAQFDATKAQEQHNQMVVEQMQTQLEADIAHDNMLIAQAQAKMDAAQAEAQNSQATENNESQVSDDDIANLLVQGIAQGLIIVGSRSGTAGLNNETAYLRGQGR